MYVILSKNKVNMEDVRIKQSDSKDVLGVRLQNIMNSLSKCKIDYVNEKEECKKIREMNTKLEVELKDARELEKSHRYHLLSSREMIENLQETVSQLVHLKRENKKIKEDMFSRDKVIAALEKDKENLQQAHNENIIELRSSHERNVEELTIINERKIQQLQRESETQIAQFKCVIEELRSKLKETEAESSDKMNIVVLEYEEKIQRGAAQVAQLQEQLSRQASRTDANIDAYRRRLEELEEKLKQSQFKQYLAQSSYPSHFETQGERPYSATRDYDSNPTDTDQSVFEGPSSKMSQIPTQNKAPKQSTLQVMYYGNKTPAQKTDKKGQFNITKKRKLYSGKDFEDF